MLKKDKFYVSLIFVTALILRLRGILYGFPFIFHPDEPTIIRTALGLRYNLNPEHFDWPSLFFYVNYFLYTAVLFIRKYMDILGISNFLRPSFGFFWDGTLEFYFITRVLCAILGALTVIPIYLTGKKLFNNSRIALFSALTLAILPFHVLHSHYALIDIPMVFFLAWSVYFSARILKGGTMRDYLLAGLFVGLAASTKYNGALGALVVFLAHFLYTFRNTEFMLLGKKSFISLCTAGLLSIFGFLIGTPYALLDYQTFIRTDGPKGALWQFTNVGKIGAWDQFLNFFNIMGVKYVNDLSLSVVLVFLVLFIYLLLRNKFTRELVFIYVPAIVFTYYISGFDKARSHYLMISYPFIVLIVGYGLDKIFAYVKKAYLVVLLWILFLAFPLFNTAFVVARFVNPDTRNLLYEYLLTNVKSDDTLYYDNSSLKLVVDKFKNPKKKVSFETLNVDGLRGIFIYSLSQEELPVPPKTPYQWNIFITGNSSTYGPNISIYRVGEY